MKSEERYSTLQVSLEKIIHIPETIEERQIENDKSRFEVVETFEAQKKVLVIGSISVRALYLHSCHLSRNLGLERSQVFQEKKKVFFFFCLF